MEKAPGFNKRLKMLDEIRKVIQTDKDVEDFYQLIQATKENMQSVTGKKLSVNRKQEKRTTTKVLLS